MDFSRDDILERELERLCRLCDESDVAGPSRPGNRKLFDTIRTVVLGRAGDRPTAQTVLDAYERVRDDKRRDIKVRDAMALSAAAALEMVGCTIDAIDGLVLSKGKLDGAASIDVISDEATAMLASSCTLIRCARVLLHIDLSLASLLISELSLCPPMLGQLLPRAGKNRAVAAAIGNHRVRSGASRAVTYIGDKVGRFIGAFGTGQVAIQIPTSMSVGAVTS